MKKILILIPLSAFVLIFSCKKATTKVSETGIYGKWQWQYSSYDIGDTLRPSSGDIIILTLNKDTTYTASLNGNVLYSGTFKDTTIASQGKLLFFANSFEIKNMDIESAYLTYGVNSQIFEFTTSAHVDSDPTVHFIRIQ